MSVQVRAGYLLCICSNSCANVRTGTLFHRVCPAMIDDDQYLFIDTAGFGAHDVSNDENFVDIIGCLNGLGPFVDIVGLLFVYGGSNSDRLGNDDLRTIQWVQCFCGPNFYSKIVLVTSKWDRLKPKAVRQAWTRMEDLLRTPAMKALHNPSTRHEGATIYHHGLPGGVGPPGEAVRVLDKDEDSEERSAELKSMITRIFKSTPIIKLQVAQELGDNGDWSKTEAAKLLSSDPQSITIEIQANRSVVCYKSNSPSPASYDPDNSTKTDAEPGESAQPSKAASNSSTSLPSSQPRKADEPHSQKKMWYQSLFKWLAVAWAAAAFFQGARAQYQNSTNTGAEGAAQSWFSAWNNSQDSWSDETEEE